MLSNPGGSVQWPKGRWGHSSVLIDNSAGPHLLVVGGSANDYGLFDINKRIWKRLVSMIIVHHDCDACPACLLFVVCNVHFHVYFKFIISCYHNYYAGKYSRHCHWQILSFSLSVECDTNHYLDNCVRRRWWYRSY